jgi:hypothetical protein
VALSQTAKDILWLRNLFEELGFPQGATPIYVDNNGTIFSAKSLAISRRLKHLDLKHHYIKELLNSNILKLDKVASVDNLADGLTKPLSKVHFRKFCNQVQLFEQGGVSDCGAP